MTDHEQLLDQATLLAGAQHGDPFSVLGRHAAAVGAVVRCYLPCSRGAWIGDQQTPMTRIGATDLFEFDDPDDALPRHYRVIIEDDQGQIRHVHDPYSFLPALDHEEMARFAAGRHYRAHRMLGAHARVRDGVSGFCFAVWAPNAARVSVVGDFNAWDGRRHPMNRHPAFGIWELFVPGLDCGVYKFEIRHRDGGVLLKSDPYARHAELRPATASVFEAEQGYDWQDSAWLRRRSPGRGAGAPMSIYEVHLGSWRHGPQGRFANYRELAPVLCRHVANLGFTHIELLPITEHPFDGSWGYQSTGYFAPTSRFGSPDDFKAFVDEFHRHGIGVILDWVPAHFPRDEHALACFDGEALYEYHDAWKAEQRDWGTLVFNFERHEVRAFLISSALFWLEEFHIDGLRVDAVASMLYLNFSQREDDWVPNAHGGHQNLEAIDFIRELNLVVGDQCGRALMIAEESTQWPGVTRGVDSGGLGFHFKWNMGWMNDTLKYVSQTPQERSAHHGALTFSAVYAFDEQFVLPLSHDEVVHLKRSLLGRMPGDDRSRMANLRLLFAYQWTFPGKKLLFMGGELGQGTEWDCDSQLPWRLARRPEVQGLMRLLAKLNALLRDCSALHRGDCDERGFQWLNGDDRARSILAYARCAPGQTVIVVLNFSDSPHPGYRVPVLSSRPLRLLLDSNDRRFGGLSRPAFDQLLLPEANPMHGRSHSVRVNLGPFSALLMLATKNR